MNEHLLSVEVYKAEDFVATDGVRVGEPLSFADELAMDDLYQLASNAQTSEIALKDDGNRLFRADSPDHLVHLDCSISLTAPDGTTQDALILVEVEGDLIVGIYLLPLGDFAPAKDYRLIGVERHTATTQFAQAAVGSFARGTHITMGDGRMRPIEDLEAGDLVLTRDSGKQPIKMIGQCTLRATGRFAPVVITKGTLHNENDLIVRPDHRLLVYQRQDFIGAGRAEVLIKARHLIDNTTVLRRKGGFIDYFQLIFDEHYLIFAEGIAAESHLVDPRSRSVFDGLGKTKNHKPRQHQSYEIQGDLIQSDNAAKLLRRATSG
ncbi:Hint domain-containing protein [Loktanella sp. S4079]|uniref:Hint domain-containing protein n=1 Tax=Loktanella sp. S4079 TaxID=579483 RepID=UPI0005FA1C9F|nr:Hint domain-containing protein [Loktanella sp. S4079]KJZ20393.1 hypothetical protein TW80_06215 [Loktanella sp. S4079]